MLDLKSLDYARAELLRFRPWAIAFFLVHLAVLGFLSRVVDLAQQPKAIYQLFGAVYALAGVLLGAYQMGNYRKPNAWLNLLHRPIAHGRLALALMGAAALLLLAGVLLPMAIIEGLQHGLGARVLDARHALLAVSGWLVSVCGYLAGAYALLANRRYAIAGAFLLFELCFVGAHGVAAIALQLGVMAWLAAMVWVSFKPDLGAPPRSAAGMAIVGVPLQMAMWVALVMLGFGFELLWLVQGTHPNNLPVPVVGSAKEADNFTGSQLMAAGLAASRDPQAQVWREQAAISDVATTGPGLTDLPRRPQLTNPAPLEFDDATRRVRWTFSHDDLRFHGVTLADQHPAGTLGVLGQHPFPMPPLPIGDGLLVTRQGVYQFDEEAGRILPRASVPAGEEVVGLDQAGERIVLLSQRALYLYDARELQTSDGMLTPRVRMPVPGPIGKLGRVDLMELVDGALVSFTFTRGVYKGEGLPYQSVVRVDEQGHVDEVARRELSYGAGPVYMYSRWYASPLAHAAHEAWMRLFAGYVPEFDVSPPPKPRTAVAIALALLVLSVGLAAWRLRRTDTSPAMRAAWIALGAVVGLPAVLALWLLFPLRERLDDLPLALPAAA